MVRTFIPNAVFTKKVLKLIIPIALGQMLVAMVSFIDQFMVSHVDVANPLASVLFATEIMYVAMGFNLGIAIIGDVFAAQFYGAKMIQKLKDVTKWKILLNITSASILVTFINIFAVPLIHIFMSNEGAGDPEFLQRTVQFLKFISISHMMYAITISLIGSLSTIGKPYFQFLTSLMSLIINITFNFVFIYNLNFGVVGAAYSTIIARSVEMSLISLFVYRNREKIGFNFKIWELDWHIFRSMLRRSLIVTSQVAFALGLVTKTATWTNFYPDLKEAFGIGYAISGLLWATLPGFSAAAKIVIGKQMARNRFERAYDEACKMLFLSIMVALALGIVVFSIAFWVPQVSGLKGNDQHAARMMIMAESTLMSFIVVAIFIFSLLEAGGFSKASTFLNSYYILVIVFPFAFSISKFWHPSFEVAYWITQIVHFVGVGMIALPFFFRKRWLRNITASHLEVII